MTLQNFTLGTFAQGAAGGGAAFESIATLTGTAASTLTFSSIPSTYQHLQIRYIARDAGAGTLPVNMWIEFNDNTASNYTRHFLTGTGASATATGETAATVGGTPLIPRSCAAGGMTANIFGAGIIDILDYASTSKNKTVRAFVGTEYNTASTNQQVNLFSTVWLQTSAINKIEFYLDSGQNFTASSVFALYGIKGA